MKHIGHIGSSIGRFANIGMRGLTARATGSSTPSTTTGTTTPGAAPALEKEAPVRDLLEAFPDLARDVPLLSPGRLDYRVNARFVGLPDAAQLRIAEVDALLREYQDLVGLLRKRGLVE